MKWRSAWPIFYGPLILPYILKTIWCIYIILSEYESVQSMFDLKINVGHLDLYFMVQWFCLISWRLFHVWTALLGIINQYVPVHDLKINVGHRDLYVMVQWFCLVSWRLFDVCTSNFQSMNQYDPDVWPQNKCRSLWPIFHGPVIVPYTLKAISCMNIIISDYESVWPEASLQNKCRILWPIFHGPVILCYILKTILSMKSSLRIMS